MQSSGLALWSLPPKSGLCSDQLIHQLKLTFGHRSTTTPISLWPMQIGKTVLILAQPLTAYPPSPKPKPSHCIVNNLTISPNKTKPLYRKQSHHLTKQNQTIVLYTISPSHQTKPSHCLPPSHNLLQKHLSKINQANHHPLSLIYLDF